MKGYNKRILKFSTEVPVRIRTYSLIHHAPLRQVCAVPTQQVLVAPSFRDDKSKAQRHWRLCPRSPRVVGETVGLHIQAPKLCSLCLFTSMSPTFCTGGRCVPPQRSRAAISERLGAQSFPDLTLSPVSKVRTRKIQILEPWRQKRTTGTTRW